MKIREIFVEFKKGVKAVKHNKKSKDPAKEFAKAKEKLEPVKPMEGLREFSPDGSGTPPRGPKTPGRGPWGDGDEDPYSRPEPKYYSRSIGFFGKFEADHFDREDFDKKTGVFKGYWENNDGSFVQIAYFKFDDPRQAAQNFDDSPGMGWYYEPDEDSNIGTSAEPAVDRSAERKQQELSMINAFLKSGLTPKPGSQIYGLMKKHGMLEGVRDPEDWDEGNTEPPNNFAIYINGKKWKVFQGRGRYADDEREMKQFYDLKAWCQRKSDATGKKWEVSRTGERATENIKETATPGATSAGNVAVLGMNPKLSPGPARGKKSYIGSPGKSGTKAPPQPKVKQPKSKYGTAKNALDMKHNIFGGGAIKRK